MCSLFPNVRAGEVVTAHFTLNGTATQRSGALTVAVPDCGFQIDLIDGTPRQSINQGDYHHLSGAVSAPEARSDFFEKGATCARAALDTIAHGMSLTDA